MDRKAAIRSLIRFDKPLADLKQMLATLGWDADPVATLTRRDIATVLQRFLDETINAEAVGEWANLVEGREDIAYEAGNETTIGDAIFGLANPDLQGRLQSIAPELMKRLTRD